MSYYRVLAAAFVIFAISGNGGASAASVVFDFTTLGAGQTNVLNVSSGGVDLRITAVNRSVNTGNPPPNQFPEIRVTFNAAGLGARVPGQDPNLALDSIGPDEALRFRVTGLPTGINALRLDEVVLANFDTSEEFTLTIDNDSIIYPDLSPAVTTPWLLATDIVDPALRTGSQNFRFQVASDIPAENDSFRISSLTFETVTVIAEPRAGTFLSLFLVALVFFTRRRNLHNASD